MQNYSQDPNTWLSPVTAWLGWCICKQLLSGPGPGLPRTFLTAPQWSRTGTGRFWALGAKQRGQKESSPLSSFCGSRRKSLSVHTHHSLFFSSSAYRMVFAASCWPPVSQPQCLPDLKGGLVDCWEVGLPSDNNNHDTLARTLGGGLIKIYQTLCYAFFF